MSSLWRRRRSGRRSLAGKRDDEEGINSGTKLSIPTHFRCPISLDLMKDPVSLATGITYDRDCIEKWLDAGNVTCPVTKQVLRNFDQIPNHALRKMIQCWCVENKSNGVERIPTPRIPITPYEVTGVCSRMAAATSRGDGDECQELVKKVKKWAKESERNQKCLVSNGIGAVLAEMFKHFSVDQKSWSLLREIICALTWSFPLSKEAISKLKSSCCMIASFLNEEEDVSTRRNAIFVLKELSISDDQGFVADTLVQEGKGIEDALLRMMKEPPICPKTTQASLVVIHHMILSTHPTISSRFIKMGLLSLILDIIVDGNKSMCEKGLCLLDEICNLEEGKGSACGNALTVPILVKKILRVSNATTDFCVSILWKMCLGLGGNEETPIRALQFGGFQKVLVVLQVGCGEGTKEKATELLRFMNAYRDKVECFDSSMGFKYLQRSI